MRSLDLSNATNPTGSSAVTFTSDGTSGGAATLTTTINALSATSLGLTGATVNLNSDGERCLHSDPHHERDQHNRRTTRQHRCKRQPTDRRHQR